MASSMTICSGVFCLSKAEKKKKKSKFTYIVEKQFYRRFIQK